VPPRTRAKAVVIPDTVDKQVGRAVAKVKAAEAQRRANALPPDRPGPKTRASAQAAPHPAPDEPHTLEAAVQGLRPEFLQCRDYGHAWRKFTAKWLPSFNLYDVREKCMRCDTTRARSIGRHGERLGAQYEYPDGYQMTGMGRLSGDDRDVIRLASVLHVLDDDEERRHA
jgi:hypothetical protein